MELKFLGRGAAFNPKEGNTSAFFIENNELFLIDCGETVFSKIIDLNLLNNIEKVNVMITHSHSDHIGSLSTLCQYVYHTLNKAINIIVKDDNKHYQKIETILQMTGCRKEEYNFIDERNFDNKYESFNTIRFKETKHKDILDCYSIIFETPNGIIYYSGDTRESTLIEELINSNQKIDKMYIDTTNNINLSDIHLYLGVLEKIIPPTLKNQTYCMHFNSDKCIEDVQNSGFNIVEVYK